jgi:hypothetical protein
MITRALLPCLLLVGSVHGQDNPDDLKSRLKATVSFLASEEMKGRRAGTPEGEKAARWMAEQFEKIGLKKGAADGYLQKFKLKGDTSPDGFNVLGVLEGSTDEFVAVCCHHDHVGMRDGKIYPGADDNASACAVLLEAARLCAAAKEKPRRGILFCSFDAEEQLLVGSRHFVYSGLYDLSKVAALVCMDLVGGNFFPRDTTSLYVLGAENSPEILDVLRKIPKIEKLDLRPMGVNVIEPLGEVFARSDYGSFRMKKVPFVFLSTGQPWYYHKPEDVPARLNFEKMEKGVGFVQRLVQDLAALEAKPRYVKQHGLSIDDLKVIVDTVRRFLEHPEDLTLTEDEISGLKASIGQVEEIVKAGEVTPKDGELLQKVAITLMGLASRRPKGEN